MPRAVSRNNIIAGIFVVASIILAVAISIAVSGATKRLTPTTGYIVRFPILSSTAGLKPGSAVTLGGQEVGRVAAVKFYPEQGRPEYNDVHVRINTSVTLYQDAWAFMERPLLGSMSEINLARVGGEPDPKTGVAAGVLPPEGVLPGEIAPPTFLAQAGFGPEQIRQIRGMVGQAANIMDRIDRVTAQVEKEVDPTISTFKQTLRDVKDVTGDVKAKWPQWSAKADEIVDNVDKATGRLSPIADQLSGTLSDADKTIKDFQDLVAQNRPGLNQAIQNVVDASAGWREGATAFQDTAHRINSLVQEQTPNLRTMLASFRLAADQVKLASVEVRRSPWRLFHTPTTKELREESLYDAAEAYASAVSDLKAASESLQVAATPGPVPVDRDTAEHIASRLQEVFERYKVAEQELLKQMEKK